MKRLASLLMPLMALTAEARTLTDFEDGTTGRLTVDTERTVAGCFTALPAVMDNPDKTSINTSAKCFGAVNKAGAGTLGDNRRADTRRRLMMSPLTGDIVTRSR